MHAKLTNGNGVVMYLARRIEKGWFVIFRLYGPLEPWFKQTWRPGEIELVE
jgi:hypothetical protein